MAGNIRKHEAEPSTPATQAHPLVALRDEVDRLFDSFLPIARGVVGMDSFRRLGGAFRALGDIAPEVDLKETDDGIEICAELPGMDEKDVSITVRGGVLSISGEKRAERKEEKADYHLSERSFGAFTRTFRLPEDVDDERIEADFSKGVLTVTVPKKAEAVRPEKKVEIKGH